VPVLKGKKNQGWKIEEKPLREYDERQNQARK
jgi:hypothetical protein